MNELMEQVNKTPIEIALDIDEDGMTTARKLYTFLELAQGQFSRWVKSNIVDNEFATENEDYWRFDIDVETPTGGIVKRDDYKLTAHFAKKLSMKGNGEKAEEAREYFTHLEERVKQKAIDFSQLSPELQMFSRIFQSVAEQQLEQKRQAEKVEQLDKKVDSIKDVIALNPNSWRTDSAKIINKIALQMGGYEHIKAIREESYKLLEERMGVALSIRLSNKKKTQALNGVSKSKIDKLNQLDVIADDKKLIQGYVSVIKDMAIKYGVTEVAAYV
ncbi:antA/AntB antirepressor family protein [Roseburia hominis]|uniref:antA/AntB antirepressor family protein n=1 Tax=Roseburia hominis TaxID=301301 RepID=UPI002016D640|nr:antA/AntB antirepressor family protein [Roseburia hominis]MCL3786154.1 antA/AntB antirepressor family protein [Roseburia hominis]